MNNDKSPFKNFHGSIDDFLKHCLELDTERIEDENVMLSHDEAIDTIMGDYKLPREEAERIIDEIQLDTVNKTIKKLIEEGLVEVASYDENGEASYQLTAMGHKYATEMKKR